MEKQVFLWQNLMEKQVFLWQNLLVIDFQWVLTTNNFLKSKKQQARKPL